MSDEFDAAPEFVVTVEIEVGQGDPDLAGPTFVSALDIGEYACEMVMKGYVDALDAGVQSVELIEEEGK